jgi:Ca2+-binding EF-hand superfamily protein
MDCLSILSHWDSSAGLRAAGMEASMKHQLNQTRPFVPLLAAAALFAAPAHAGILDPNAVFVAADLDVSGSLTLAEFTTTLDAGISVRAATKKFNSADRNVDGSIDLNEYLIFTGTIPAPTRIEELFDEADADVDGSLSFDEFAATFNAKASIVSIRRFFVRADADVSGTLSEEEWQTYKQGGRGLGAATASIFELADFDANGELTLTEYGYVFPRTAASAKILVKFNKLDDDEDGVLTPEEYNPGVRRGGAS